MLQPLPLSSSETVHSTALPASNPLQTETFVGLNYDGGDIVNNDSDGSGNSSDSGNGGNSGNDSGA